MTDAEVTINDQTEGAGTVNVDTESLTVGAKTVHRQRLQVAGSAADEIATVTDSAPAGSEFGLVTRNVPSGTQDVEVTAALPAGDNNVGNVDIVTLPALASGTNNIGDVDVLTLPALPSGSNNIGDVDVLTLPAIPAGSNLIGSVSVGATVKTPLFLSVSVASSGQNQLVAADASNKIKVVSIAIVADGSVTAKFQSGNTDISGAMAFAANGGMTLSAPAGYWLMEAAVNNALNINLGGAVGVRGFIVYFKEP